MASLYKKQKNIALMFFVFLAAVYLLNSNIAITHALTSADELFSKSLNDTAAKTGHKDLTTINQPFAQTVGNFIRFGLSFIGVIFLGLMIYGGYRWMLARGKESEVGKTKE